MKNYLLISFIYILMASNALAQEVVSTAGESQQAGSYELSWTIGEPVMETLSSGSNSLTQGFHQTKLIVTAITKPEISEFEIQIFPNPTADFVNIQFQSVIKNISYQLYNNTGSLIQQNKIVSANTRLNFSNYASGQYILKITEETNCPIQTFKIIKR